MAPDLGERAFCCTCISATWPGGAYGDAARTMVASCWLRGATANDQSTTTCGYFLTKKRCSVGSKPGGKLQCTTIPVPTYLEQYTVQL